MSKQLWIAIGAVTLIVAGVAYAQYPIMDAVANKVVQKYQSASCEQLWEKKGQPKSAGGAARDRLPEERPADARSVLQQGCRVRSSTRCSNAG